MKGDTTDGEGKFEVKIPYGWRGTLTPSKGDIVFSPGSLDYLSQEVTNNTDHCDFQLAISTSLTVERRKTSTFLISKDYALVEVRITLIAPTDNLDNSKIHHFTVSRRAGNEEWIEIEQMDVKLPSDALSTFEDKYLEQDVEYTYKVEVHHNNGDIIGESSEKTI